MKKNVRKAAVVVLTVLLIAAVIMGMTGCPIATGPEDEGFAKLLSSDGADSGYFGGSVSIDGNYAIVGACGGTLHMAYIFVRSS